MNQNRFPVVRRPFTRLPSRREVLRGLAGAGVGIAVARPGVADAKQKRKQRIRFNAFGCVDVGGFCRNAGHCCSGICEGKRRKRKCRAHDGGSGCRAGQIEFGCGPDPDVACTTSTGQAGICNTTTGNAGYCIASASCAVPCTKDADCRLFCGADAAACIRCDGCASGTACVGPSTGDCPPEE